MLRRADRAGFPSTDVDEIGRRHDLVEALVDAAATSDDLRSLLRQSPDASHVLQRVLLRRSDAANLLAMADFIQVADTARQRLDSVPKTASALPKHQKRALNALVDRLRPDIELASALTTALIREDDNTVTPPSTLGPDSDPSIDEDNADVQGSAPALARVRSESVHALLVG